MFCQKCGAENLNSAKFCKQCGNQASSVQSVQSSLQNSHEQGGSQQKKKTFQIIGIILCLPVLISVLFGGRHRSYPTSYLVAAIGGVIFLTVASKLETEE